MRGIPSLITDIRKQVFAEVARMACSGDYTDMEDIPFKIVPGQSPLHRESVFLERAIAGERVRLAMGLSLQPVQTRTLLTEGMDQAAIAEQYYEPPLVNIIPYACHACPTKQYRVTELCQGCLASSCQRVCPKGAIKFVNGKSRIDQKLCIKCGKCARSCPYNAITYLERPCQAACGMDAIGVDEYGKACIDYDRCVSCGQCIVNCPTGAIYEKDDTAKVLEAINDPEKFVVVHTAPSIRVTLGECFGMHIGTNVQGKMVAALRRLGFDKVFDTDFGADLTIVEEANEFLGRVQNGGVLPMITSCSPGWIKYCEHYYPDMLDHLSTCKSPQQMSGAIIKTWYAEKMGIDPKDIVVVGIMPCTAKKFETKRNDQAASGYPDVDYSLTTRELGRMIESAGIYFKHLPDEEFDNPLGDSTGAAVIFGATGGVMEAALRTAVEKLSGEELKSLDFTEVRGTDGIKEASYTVNGMEVKVCVVSGLANANTIMEKVKNGTADYHFIEIMGCPGGCVNGGGQPIQHAVVRNFVDLKARRAAALYEADKDMPLRKSHESEAVKRLYAEFLGEPGSHKAHEVLHTSYVARPKYK